MATSSSKPRSDEETITGLVMLVIFDFDGTLADTWPWLADALVSGADRFGYRPVTHAELEDLRRRDSHAIFERLAIPLDKLAMLAADLRRRAEANVGVFRLFPGVPELVRALRATGATLAVVSSNTETAVRGTLGAELARCFAFFGCGIDVFGKADAFAGITRRADASPSDTVAAGDETRDLEAARSAGIRALAVAWGYADAELLRSCAPGRTAASADELLALIGTRDDEVAKSSGQ